MPIDDPLGALKKQFENEDRERDPVLIHLAGFASMLGLPWPLDQAIGRILGRLTASRIERIELMLETVQQELRRHEDRMEEIRREVSQGTQQRSEEWLALVQDGLMKAERTRAKERVQRLGKILANALVSVPPPHADIVEEMMRVAVELSDRDVELLAELVRIQGSLLGHNGMVQRYTAWESWPKGPWGDRLDSEIESTFSKLEGFGLVNRLAPPNNLTIAADFQNRYGLLEKGMDFIRFVKGGR